MMRINLVLLLALVLSGLYLVGVQYESRRVFTELDRARTEARRLEAENERLQVQKRAAATPVRVERLAKDKLQMRQTTPGITTYVSYPGLAGKDAAPAKAAEKPTPEVKP
ncbi:cell division protein FtsL [Curvibacter sp. APW13]|uniref:cell division protein FtsL n=1 Tax=Curvibacter sp. APW13 TaxID=3077236 RepID=UPI0028DEB86B|nr:cell division protein FtsL [Curvibacter sp. APW13]MDT8989804.1 cell division protein FtsL [Curvibacter sp. APW13]